MTFQELNLNRPLLNALEDLEFTNPTPIQQEAYSVIMSGKDVVGVAQTGTGKTFAYLLPVLRQLKFSEKKHPRILIVVPTRELVLQVVGEIEKLTKYMSVRFAGVYGGTNIKTQGQVVYDGLDILVATPGRLYDLNLTGVLRLKSVQTLIIDEVDEMLNLGFRNQLLSFFETLPDKRQNLMFSATLTPDVDALIKDFFYEPTKIEIAAHGTPLEKIKQSVYYVPNYNTKLNLLKHLLEDEELSKVLIFADSKKSVDKIHELLAAKYPNLVGAIHSNKSQNFRFNALKRFESGEQRILLATDVASRGLDIRDVSHVINFDTPEAPADYLHRIGRTGRAEKDGHSILLVSDLEQEYHAEIETLMGKVIPVMELPEEVKISDVFLPDEKPNLADKNYMRIATIKEPQGAFHEKSEKNQQINSGSPSKKRKKRKPISKGGKQKLKNS